MSRRFLLPLVLIPAALTIGGCTGLSERISDAFDRSRSRETDLVRNVGRNAPDVVNVSSPLVSHDDGIWLGKKVIKLGQPSLPPIFNEPTTFDRTVNSLSELAERITVRSGIATKVTPEALAISNAAFPRNAFAGGAGASAAGPLLPPGMPAAGNMMAQPAPQWRGAAPAANQAGGVPSFGSEMQGGGIRFSYANGSLKGLLDTASARFGVSWKYADGTIQFFHTESRTFQISAIPGDSSFAANVTSGATSTGGVSSSGSGGGDSGSGSSAVSANNTQNTGVTSKLSVYTGIESAIKVMLSPYGKVLASPATGAITVVDTPDSLERIAAYIDGENKTLSRQIVINVTVLSVNLADSDAYGINWAAVYNSLSRHYGITNSYATADKSPVGFSAGIVGSSRFSGTTVMINALSEQGKVRRQTTASVVTLNNQPVPVQVATQTSYLQSSQTSVVAQVGTTTTLIPGVVTAGFNMSILPHLLANGTVMLQFSTDISTLRQLRVIESNGTRIESPELDTRNFLQRVSMKSNETLVISGFEQIDDNLDRRGVGTPKNFVLGGGVDAASTQQVIVVLITPVTMSGT